MYEQYDAMVRSAAALGFDEQEMSTEIAWETNGRFISLIMTNLEDGQSGTLVIRGMVSVTWRSRGVFAEANTIEELDTAQLELVIRCWNPQPHVHDSIQRSYILLSYELYAAIEDAVRDGMGISVGLSPIYLWIKYICHDG